MPTKKEILDKVAARVRELLPEDQAPRVEEFVRQYYGWTAEEDLVERSPVDIYGAAVAHWNFMRQRRPGEAKVRVYNPRHEEYGWQSTHTAIEIVNDDMPFLVDSTSMEITRLGYEIHFMNHPIVRVRRDGRGRLLELLPPDAEDALQESLIHIEVNRRTEPEALEELRWNLERVLGEVRAAVEDWPRMRRKIREIVEEFEKNPPPVDREEVSEVGAFLRWLDDHHFTFLGYREYELAVEDGEDVLRTVPGTGLGILRQEGREPRSRSFAKLPPEVRRLARSRHLLNLTKANSRSPVHRPSYLDYVGVKRFDENGEVCGERRFLGLYTSAAYSMNPRDIPLIRRKIENVMRRTGFPPNSHYEKALLEVFETFPRDQLLQISEEELYDIALGIVHLQERQRVRLFVRRDTYGRFLSCLVYLPRERHNTQTRQRIQEILQREFNGRSVEFSVHLSESVLARLHFIVYTDSGAPRDYDIDEIEARIVEATREWPDTLYGALVERFGEERGTELFNRYRNAFPPGYRDEYLTRTAAADIEQMESLGSGEDLGMRLYHRLEEPEDFLRFRLYRRGDQISLSEVMPLLEDMGVKVLDQRPYRIEPAGGEPVWIHDFGLIHRGDGEFRADGVREIFQDAFARTWHGAAESDGFNRLVLGARLTWREITVLRAYCKYLRQTETTFSQNYMEDTLSANPRIARLLIELFEARFDPERRERAAEESERLRGEIESALEHVASLDEDRILRSFLNLIQATLRTNYFREDRAGEPKTYLSLKLDPSRIPELPLPRPMFEIFVYSPRTEGVHLRGGRVARGGIRWSDRREDFRTEILGLMKAQMVKNAVIVPVGAKGGFVVKRPPADGGREALQREVVECYKTLVRGMLDVTDNLVDGEVRPPERVVRYDGDDPYLVVAADKGTATFSDIANGISEEYGFWLGDAFASGGSAGYDHKAMGITARGAWESVKRHFRELGMNVQEEDFTVVGIGDMSGDVFGNGMLQSRHIRLVGAFDHRHIFLDPDPDPERSYEERRRLFELPRSTWADYDPRVISEGGGVWPRTAKSIPLSPQVRELLDVDAERMTPNELISALLKAPVDLLFNGGIGTYVKASGETHAEVGDKANDAVRVDAADLRCRVVGEGGNLGFTQRGRIEYALGGGRIYMDAIDNSAGVDCSDHEVNIKILLDSVVESGDMTEKQRNELLEEMTEEVASLVLRDNYLQTQAISNSVAQANSMAEVHARYIRALESSGVLNRELEFLPQEEEIAERKSEGGGLAAPEFAVLLSYTKISTYDGLLKSDLPDDPYFFDEFIRYFPHPLQERFRERMKEHRLRREITATHVTNGMVNRAGTTFAYRMSEETGAALPDIARAYTAARQIFSMRELWAEIEALDGRIPATTQTRMLLEARKLVERATRWLLRNRRPPLEIRKTIAYFAPGAAELAEHIPQFMLDGDRKVLERRARQLAEDGVPADLANRLATLSAMFSALDIVDVAAATGHPVATSAAVYFHLGDRLRLHWLREHIEALPRDTRWQTLARAALRDDLYNLQAELTAEVLLTAPENRPAPERIEAWAEENRRAVDRTLQVLADINSGGVFDLSTLSVALREIRNLVTAATPPTPERPR
ncbi:NAD-glutamate dehydrogenase [Rubrobacter taiwanensis]|uniref:NAD-glutamate dehydrogenase n=1 Tax=Rubrobacter taiwanensis TaxID=185139 RepID=A0A4R1BG37_9ACTN|nr:NAD-glutamate dehydrogenase [Rubrobacter taiwanensis]TCJ16133.1 NAD-glutamate dehydrogenase [Rubrobacter taiwanensis]